MLATSAAAPASSQATPPARSRLVGSTGLQVVESTTAQNRRIARGGTVVGAAIQETPPKRVRLSGVHSRDPGTHLINVNQATLYRFDMDG